MLPLPAGREASAGVVASVYERHRPERTLLYQLVEEHYPAFKAELAAQGVEPQYPLSHALFGWRLRRWRQWGERPVPVDQGADERRTHPIGAHHRSTNLFADGRCGEFWGRD